LNNSQEEQPETHNKSQELNCPFLGMQDDSDTFFAYASPGNFCYKVKSPQPITNAHQVSCCLDSAYKKCPVFSSPENQLIISEFYKQHIFEKSSQGKLIRIPITLLIGIITVFVVLIISFSYFYFGLNPIDKVQISSLTLTSEASEAQPQTQTSQTSVDLIAASQVTTTSFTSPVDLPTLTPIPYTPTYPVATNTTAPSATPTQTTVPTPSGPTPGPGLETPFGPDKRFLLHKVATGESFTKLTSKYQTTTEVLNSTNQLIEGASLWVGTVLVIMPGQTDPSDLPKFFVISIEEQTSLINISSEYGVSVDTIRYFNDLGELEWIPAGRWLIIPLEES
jgi:LysM repeat protein